ncbi:helix-turn-helix domain-containing protein [Actinoplanes sp. NPDC049681]|uniref:helix-turn-helix domain-containing protein n=1 Tax=Actinoplanes sp. NPDC049681 TaxID=3363905 RepID=UPI00379A952E
MSVTTTPKVPPDPTGAATPIEFARRLRALMDACRRSLDSVALRSRDAGTPISRATVHNLVTARSVPRRDSLVAFLRGCGIPPREQIRWLTAFDAVYPDQRRGAVPQRACADERRQGSRPAA